jgi:hypothetical protein
MPLHSNFAMALTLAGTLACSIAIQVEAESPGIIHLAQAAEQRDLKPVHKDDIPRPKVALISNATVVPIGGWINFRVSSSVSGYGHLYVMSASGRAQVWLGNVPIVAGQRLVFPVGSIGIKAEVGLDKVAKGRGLSRTTEEFIDELAAITRQINVHPLAPARWAPASTRLWSDLEADASSSLHDHS